MTSTVLLLITDLLDNANIKNTTIVIMPKPMIPRKLCNTLTRNFPVSLIISLMIKITGMKKISMIKNYHLW